MPFGPTRKSAGDRRHRVELQTATVVVDALRGRTNVWATYATVWGAVDEQPFVVTEQNASLLYLVTVLYDGRIRVQQRAVIVDLPSGDLRLKVLALVNPELRNRDQILYCAEARDDQ